MVWSLEKQCNRADLSELFKMIKGFSGVAWSQFFVQIENSTTHGHSWKLHKWHNQLNIRRHFSQHRINQWNSLTQDAVDAPSVYSFKKQFAKRILWQKDFFMYWRSSKSYGCTTFTYPSSPSWILLARCRCTRWLTHSSLLWTSSAHSMLLSTITELRIIRVRWHTFNKTTRLHIHKQTSNYSGGVHTDAGR